VAARTALPRSASRTWLCSSARPVRALELTLVICSGVGCGEAGYLAPLALDWIHTFEPSLPCELDAHALFPARAVGKLFVVPALPVPVSDS
jgi:hypothetical protein